jgi:hypothetical protein
MNQIEAIYAGENNHTEIRHFFAENWPIGSKIMIRTLVPNQKNGETRKAHGIICIYTYTYLPTYVHRYVHTYIHA